MTAGPLQSGESLHFLTEDGAFADTNGWPVEVEECAAFDKDMPVKAFAINTDIPTIRNVTSEFYTAVRRHSRPDDHEADETFMLHADFRRTA